MEKLVKVWFDGAVVGCCFLLAGYLEVFSRPSLSVLALVSFKGVLEEGTKSFIKVH